MKTLLFAIKIDTNKFLSENKLMPLEIYIFVDALRVASVVSRGEFERGLAQLVKAPG